jgi:hypothetical protein
MIRFMLQALQDPPLCSGTDFLYLFRLPGRLAFLIRDAVPQSALTAGHIFMGFTSCGQFLLSYTQTTTENDLGKGEFQEDHDQLC